MVHFLVQKHLEDSEGYELLTLTLDLRKTAS
jgi:hypothetical protein